MSDTQAVAAGSWTGVDKPIDKADAFSTGALRPDELPALARLHHEFFSGADLHGQSLANLGPGFLERVFYRLNLDNPQFFVDVARYQENVIGFSVYVSDHRHLMRYVFRKHLAELIWEMTRLAIRRPGLVLSHIFGNLSLLGESLPPAVRSIPGWHLLLAVKPEYSLLYAAQHQGQSAGGQPRASIARELVQRMEGTMTEHGCLEYWAAPFAQNAAANNLFQKSGAELIATGAVQGMRCNFYRKAIVT